MERGRQKRGKAGKWTASGDGGRRADNGSNGPIWAIHGLSLVRTARGGRQRRRNMFVAHSCHDDATQAAATVNCALRKPSPPSQQGKTRRLAEFA